jgi:glucose-1-phosphate thymidylyltransferase
MNCGISKGILLAGGTGSRLYPLTLSVNKHLLALGDKPIIFYPLCNFINAGIYDILIICNPGDDELYKRLFGDGSHLGLKISYAIQDKPMGLPEAFIIAEEFLQGQPAALNLGDHIFLGPEIEKRLPKIVKNFSNTTLFCIESKHPQDSGVVEFNDHGLPIRIVEKPEIYISNWVVCGLYLYDASVCSKAKLLSTSSRNELEISDLNNRFLNESKVDIIKLPSTVFWEDAGTAFRLNEISNLLMKLEKSKKYYGYVEFEAFKQGLISKRDIENLLVGYEHSDYASRVIKLIS